MSLTNISQLLMRNIDLLSGQNPLLVNLPDDHFGAELLTESDCKTVTYLDTHFGNYSARIKRDNVKSIFDVHYDAAEHDLVILRFPKSKAELLFTLKMLNSSLKENTPIMLVGENKSGIKSLPKLAKDDLANVIKQDAAKHCLLFSAISLTETGFDVNQSFTHYSVTAGEQQLKVAALPGVFSQKKLDKGTQVLFKNMPTDFSGKVLDFGTGAGVIAAYVGSIVPGVELELADVSALALESAKRTLTLNKLEGKTTATDSLSKISGKYDVVVSNPPFHQGISTYYRATEEFLKGIESHLNSKGRLIMVANSFLKYQPIMEQHFSKVSVLAIESGFTIYQAFK